MWKNLNKEQLDIGKDLILQYKDRVRHRIDLVDETSFKHRYRRIPPSMYDEVRSHLKQLLDNAVIRPSHSPFASAIVIVRKKNGTMRMPFGLTNGPATYQRLMENCLADYNLKISLLTTS